MNQTLRISALVAALIAAPLASAETVPDAATERGFVAGKAFSLAQYDAVNLFNGGLSLDLEIGPAYAVGPNFSYQLKLTYSSKVWEYGTPDCAGSTGYPSWIGLDAYNPDCLPAGIASPSWNAGLGWHLGFGYLVDGPLSPVLPWYEYLPAGYHSPDGAVHAFFDSLHDTDWSSEPPFNDEYCGQSDSVCFSRDSSYLRLRRTSQGVVVESPDGVRRTFGYYDGSHRWLPTRIEDAFGNGMTISYPDDMTWVVTDDRRGHDSGQETLKVLFEPDPLHPGGKRVAQVLALTFRDQGGRRSQIDFVYFHPVPAEAPLPECRATQGRTDQESYRGGMLQRLVHPVETSGLPDSWNFGFDYYLHQDDDGEYGGNAHCDEFAGQLQAMELPTGGTIEWTYSTYLTPALDCVGPPEQPIGGGPREPPAIIGQNFGATSGVLTRREVGANGTELSYRLYAPGSVFWPADPRCGQQVRSPIKHVGRVQYQQIGNGKVTRTESYFSTLGVDISGGDPQGFRPEEYGLPLTHAPCEAGASSCPGLTQPLLNPRVFEGKTYLLSSTTHRCEDEDMSSPWSPLGLLYQRGIHSSCELYEAKYVRYERSFKHCSLDTGSCSQINSRVAGEMTVHFVDSANDNIPPTEASFETTSYSNFGGFGIFRRVDTGGNVPAPGGGDGANQRSTLQDLIPAGELNLAADGESITSSLPDPATVEPWWFGRAHSVEISEPGKGKARTEFCYGNDGFLVGKRTLSASTGIAQANDQVVKFGRGGDEQRGGDGFVTSIHYMGGDRSPLVNFNLCAPPAPTEGEYVVRSSSSFAVPRFTAFQRGGVDFLVSLDLDIHASGLVAASRDHAGVSTLYRYDDRGRLNDIDPQGGAKSEIRYQTDNGGRPEVTVTLRDSGVIRSERFVYDDLGRLREEHHKVPGANGTTIDTVRCRQYVQAGFVKLETEFLPGSTCAGLTPNQYTDYDDYDPYGRPKHITSPDGALSKVNYQGGHTKIEVRWPRTASGVQETKTEYLTNRQGHLIQVTEDSTALRLKTRYRYDLGGRLSQVDQIDDSPNGTGLTQRRTFTYDQRGFLKSETQPELGIGGNGTLLYSGYDSLGNVGARAHETSAPINSPWSFTLDYRYDAAGRLVQVLHEGQPAKEYFYARGDEAGAWGAGRLYQTKRRNRVPARNGALAANGLADQVVVTETFLYNHAAGRLTERQVRTSDGGLFSTTFDYDSLGNVVNLGYPHCAHPAACSVATPNVLLSSQYRLGMLTTISGFAPSISYHSNGLWSIVEHSNGVRDELTLLQAPGAVALPGRLRSLRGASTLLDLGPYSYDNSRNVTAVGADQFYYDVQGRLVRADLQIGGVTETQLLAYDRFSNLLSMTRVNGPAGAQHHMPVNAATNRLEGGAEYDQGGNQVFSSWGASRLFDPFHQLVAEVGTGVQRSMLYNADDERLAVRDEMSHWITWSLRGMDNRVLRQIAGPLTTGSWQWKKDYVYRGSSLLAASIPSAGGGTTSEHFHLDHLGSTRLVTDAAGQPKGAVIKYWPYGEVAEGASEGEVMRFTGHERDFNCLGAQCPQLGPQDDLDYMHARYYSPWNGRFLSLDPIKGDPQQPRRWNLYTYALGNPLVLVDPDGRDPLRFPSQDPIVEVRPFVGMALSFGGKIPVGFKGGVTGDSFSNMLNARPSDSLEVQGALSIEGWGADLTLRPNDSSMAIALQTPLTDFTLHDTGIEQTDFLSYDLTVSNVVGAQGNVYPEALLRHVQALGQALAEKVSSAQEWLQDVLLGGDPLRSEPLEYVEP